MRQNFVNVS